MTSEWERFVAQIRVGGICWLWAGATVPAGYGTVTRNSVACGAHRVAWEYANGPIPEGMMVCHTCDNKLCVRPSHMFLGTAKDNADDMTRKWRHRFGKDHHNCHLTNEEALEARVAYMAGGITITALANRYGVGIASMRDLLNGKNYKHVGGPIHVPKRRSA